MKGKHNIVFLLTMFVLCMLSCSVKQDSDVLSKEFGGEVWGRFDYLTASYYVVSAPMTADLVMEIAVSDVYPNVYQYHNDDGALTIVLTVNAPDGSRRAREFVFRLKDKDGNFKSEKVDGYYKYELPLINEMSFNEIGEYEFKVENKYSKDPLCGIKYLNIKCVQIKK